MYLYKLAELDPSILEKRFLYKEKYTFSNTLQLYPPLQEIQPGTFYSIDELIQAMALYSDNQATKFLYDEVVPHLNREIKLNPRTQGFNSDVAHLNSMMDKNMETLSTKNYASYFRVLFNASLLNRSNSEHVLKLLSHAEFREGLVAGVPEGVTVAHKFGESGTLEKPQLHDCGIIYHPLRPYILCVMTQGKDSKKLQRAISEISKETYKQVNEQVQEKNP